MIVDELLLRAVVADRQRWAAQQRLVRATRGRRSDRVRWTGPGSDSAASVWDLALSCYARVAATR